MYLLRDNEVDKERKAALKKIAVEFYITISPNCTADISLPDG